MTCIIIINEFYYEAYSSLYYIYITRAASEVGGGQQGLPTGTCEGYGWVQNGWVQNQTGCVETPWSCPIYDRMSQWANLAR